MKDNFAFSVSSIGMFNKCAARFDLKYNRGFKAEYPQTEAQKLGSIFHAGMEGALRAVAGKQLPMDSIIKAALLTASQLTRQEGYSPDLLHEAEALMRYYIPIIGIGTKLKPYILNGKPLIEHEFRADFPDYGVSLQGKIDAVCTTPDGRVVLVDWKTRSGEFYSDWVLEFDRQLYVYAGMLEQLYQIKVDTIAQVQMSTDLPAVPVLKKDCKGTLASDYSLKMGRTTEKVFQAAIAHLPPAERELMVALFFDKLKPETHFVHSTRIDASMIPRIMDMTLRRAAQINAETEFLPILDPYVCKACEFAKFCKQVHLTF